MYGHLHKNNILQKSTMVLLASKWETRLSPLKELKNPTEKKKEGEIVFMV